MVRRLLGVALVVIAIALVRTGTTSGAPPAGHAWAWGDNADGELGNGTITEYGGIPTPGRVIDLSGVIAVVGGSIHSLALRADGTVWAWGGNGWGQLGQGNYGSSTIPLRVPGLSGVTAIAAGDLHSLALKSDGTVWAWGYNIYGQVGNGASGDNVLSPTQVSGLRGVVAIAAGHGSDTSYALTSDGTVWAWGYDGLGELGNGTSDENAHPIPVQVAHLTGALAIGAGSDHGLALRSDGAVWAWGDNQSGQLGARTTTTCTSYRYPCSTVPVQVNNLSRVRAVAGGGDFSLALTSDGSVWGWGSNAHGQLANGTYGNKVLSPTRAHLSAVSAIAAGDNHTLALRADGTVWAAGQNDFGQLGDGTFTDSSNPVQAIRVSGMTEIGAGLDHSLAVVASP